MNRHNLVKVCKFKIYIKTRALTFISNICIMYGKVCIFSALKIQNTFKNIRAVTVCRYMDILMLMEIKRHVELLSIALDSNNHLPLKLMNYTNGEILAGE